MKQKEINAVIVLLCMVVIALQLFRVAQEKAFYLNAMQSLQRIEAIRDINVTLERERK